MSRARALTLALATGLAVVPFAPALADLDWFQHPFGERRAYVQDWLAVCADSGAGPCRLVRSNQDSRGPAFDSRVSLHLAPGGWTMEVMDRGMPSETLSELRFFFDETLLIVATRQDFIPGERDFPNILETVTLTNPDLTDRLLSAMRAGGELVITYRPEGSGDATVIIPLRGVTAGLDALTQIETERQP
ncbi:MULTISPECIES: hypothetical protein [unclassified Dinoroseobacter]|uniref:hypothetical protein n=1 Tax=unclassified Dinoroseobacter TaxID=2620028 RepID=UPI003C7DFDAD